MSQDHLAHRMRVERDHPHQPRGPAHWPEACEEIVTNPAMRLFRCGRCKAVHIVAGWDMNREDGLMCHGGSTTITKPEATT